MRLHPLAGALALVGVVNTTAGTATLLPAQSEITFTIRQMGVPVEGRFTRFSAEVNLDPRRPEAGSASLRVDAASASFGVAELDVELPKPVWLAATRFMQATFDSRSIRPLGGGRFEIDGRLTIKGRARDVVVPITLTPQPGGLSQASGSFVVKRLEHGVGEAEWSDTSLVANDVQVRFRLVLSGVDAR